MSDASVTLATAEARPVCPTCGRPLPKLPAKRRAYMRIYMAGYRARKRGE
jgi:hypothetical protein